jgi:predicted ribosome quality control (RQC) complex YloA/Tae2 family protein
VEITIDIDKSVEENAESYYEAAKQAKQKITGARDMVERAKKKLEEAKDEGNQANLTIQLDRRKPRWYEKYHWFKTTNDQLVIGGKDASTNEQVVKKHADKSDYVFHTEAPGSPFVVLKRGDNSFEQSDYDEAASFCATYSQAWKNHLTTLDVFQVKPSQVTKEAKAGEYVEKGAFMVYGNRREITADLSLSVGLWRTGNDILLMSGPHDSVHHHCTAWVDLEQGSKSKGDIAKSLMKILSLDRTDDILTALPSGEFSIDTIHTDDLETI